MDTATSVRHACCSQALNTFPTPPHLQTNINVHYLIPSSHPYKPPLIATPGKREAHLIGENSSLCHVERQHPGWILGPPHHMRSHLQPFHNTAVFRRCRSPSPDAFPNFVSAAGSFFECWLGDLGWTTVPDELD